MALLVESSRIGKYKVQNLIKANLYTETYRVVDTDNNPYFLKIFAANRLPDKLVNAKTGLVREIECSQKLQHSNIISFVESGSIELNIGTCQYYISHYYPGSILSEYVMRKGHLSEDEALKIFIPLLQALKFMHSLSPVLCHNDIVPSNIILTQRSEGEVPILIDLGHVSERCAGRVNFDTSDIDLLYHANENRVSMYDEQSDIFSLCAVLYFMLAGKAPWNIDLDDTLEFEERFKQLHIGGYDDRVIPILCSQLKFATLLFVIRRIHIRVMLQYIFVTKDMAKYRCRLSDDACIRNGYNDTLQTILLCMTQGPEYR